MDPLTHGITGALLGKGFFAERHGRVATFAATLGAVFPDVDILAVFLSHNEMAIAQLHRDITHSFICLPLFAIGLAALTRGYARLRRAGCPPWPVLATIYAVGLASHIVLDIVTSFGTMIFSPLSHARLSWDLVFIIDFVFTGVALLPQVAAWVYRQPEGSSSRALRMWLLLSLSAVAIFHVDRVAGFPFSPWGVVGASLVFAVVLFLPGWHGWGLQWAQSLWCRVGVYALGGYLGLCGVEHHTALQRTEAFAAERRLVVEAVGALPLPPSLSHWVGLVRTPNGVYQEFFNGPEPSPPMVHFFADAPRNSYIAATEQFPEVRIYLWFARFPVVRYLQQGDRHMVEFTDLRFYTRDVGTRHPFTFRVILDSAGQLVEKGWLGE